MSDDLVHGIRMDGALNLVLEHLHSNEEAIESSLYHIGPSKERITRTIEGLKELGCLEYHVREKGQKVPVYRLTDKGRDLFCVNRLMHEMIGARGEIFLDSPGLDEVLDPIRRHYLGPR